MPFSMCPHLVIHNIQQFLRKILEVYKSCAFQAAFFTSRQCDQIVFIPQIASSGQISFRFEVNE